MSAATNSEYFSPQQQGPLQTATRTKQANTQTDTQAQHTPGVVLDLRSGQVGQSLSVLACKRFGELLELLLAYLHYTRVRAVGDRVDVAIKPANTSTKTENEMQHDSNNKNSLRRRTMQEYERCLDEDNR